MNKYLKNSLSAAALVTTAGSLLSRPARAGSLPDPTLYYSGRLTQGPNAFPDVSASIEVDIFDALNNPVCTSTDQTAQLRDGNFRIKLDPMCAAKIPTTPNLHVQLKVNGKQFDQSLPIGAVPFSVVAGQADTATSATNTDSLGMVPAANYLQKTDAASLYVPLTAAASFETTSSAQQTFLTKLDAAATYLKLGGQAADSAMLGTVPAASYAQKSDLTGLETSTHAAANYLTIGGTAADSSKLGGISAGQIIDANGVVLAAALPTSVPNAPSCSAGQVVQRTSSGWTCTNLPAAAPAPMTCSAGAASSFNGTAWVCIPVAAKTYVLAALMQDQYIPASQSTFTTLNFTSTSSLWSGSEYVAPVSGTYQVSAMVRFDRPSGSSSANTYSAADSVVLGIYKHGLAERQIAVWVSSGNVTSPIQPSGSALVHLDVNETLSLEAYNYCPNGTARMAQNSSASWLQIVKVSDD